MSDSEKSGAPTPAPADLPAAQVPAEDATPAHPAQGVASAPAPAAFGSFGANRGSGLARGKRPSAGAAPAVSTPATASGYKPSTIEVLKPQSEYKNPFTGETSVSSPSPPAPPASVAVVQPPAPVPAPIPVPVPAPVASSPEADRATVASAPYGSPIPDSSASLDASSPLRDDPRSDIDSAGKAELNILPPEAAKRPSVRWESPGTEGSSERPGRPTFQTARERREGPGEGREARPEVQGRYAEGQGRGEGRSHDSRDGRGPRQHADPRDQSRGPREPRQPRDPRDERKFEPRTPRQPERAPIVEEKKPGGFMGWLKGLFGGDKPAAETGGTTAPGTEQPRDGDYGQRRHRGGRGQGGGGGGYRGENRGPRDFAGEPRAEGDYQGGGDQGGGGDGANRRRRRRGGRGRNRGEGGGGGGGERGPRPEGQQGGGAI